MLHWSLLIHTCMYAHTQSQHADHGTSKVPLLAIFISSALLLAPAIANKSGLLYSYDSLCVLRELKRRRRCREEEDPKRFDLLIFLNNFILLSANFWSDSILPNFFSLFSRINCFWVLIFRACRGWTRRLTRWPSLDSKRN